MAGSTTKRKKKRKRTNSSFHVWQPNAYNEIKEIDNAKEPLAIYEEEQFYFHKKAPLYFHGNVSR